MLDKIILDNHSSQEVIDSVGYYTDKCKLLINILHFTEPDTFLKFFELDRVVSTFIDLYQGKPIVIEVQEIVDCSKYAIKNEVLNIETKWLRLYLWIRTSYSHQLENYRPLYHLRFESKTIYSEEYSEDNELNVRCNFPLLGYYVAKPYTSFCPSCKFYNPQAMLICAVQPLKAKLKNHDCTDYESEY